MSKKNKKVQESPELGSPEWHVELEEEIARDLAIPASRRRELIRRELNENRVQREQRYLDRIKGWSEHDLTTILYALQPEPTEES